MVPPASTDDGERTVRDDRDPLLGTLLGGRFRVDFALAAGGFGAIYRGVEVSSGREVALKVLHRGLASDPKVVKRFRREGAALITLRNQHTLRAYELGEQRDGTLFIVLELLHGETLFDRLQRVGTLAPERATAIARAICSSLAEAHERGIVHRDLKPSNIHLEQVGDNPDYVKVLDFGIAKILRGSDLGQYTELTDMGRTIGTPEYMTPEQITGEPCTNRSDIYAVGVLLYEMIAGERPYRDANNATTMLASILNGPAPRLSVSIPAISPELDRVVARCLERDPRARFVKVGDLDVALALVGADRPLREPSERPTSETEDRTTHWRPYRPSQPAGSPPGPLAGSPPGPLAGSPPSHLAGSPPGPLAGLPPGPLAGSAPGPLAGSPPGPPPMFLPGPAALPPPQQAPRPRYDLGDAAARDEWARRIVWGAIFVVMAILAVILILKA